MIPKTPGIAQKGTQKSGSNPKKVPKIMAHPRITTYASYPPPPPRGKGLIDLEIVDLTLTITPYNS